MKAIVQTNYGPPEVLQRKEMAKPEPKANEVLIRVVATTVTSGDCRLRSFTVPTGLWLPVRLIFGLRKPRRMRLGTELAGEIEAVGQEVKHFQQGDQIFASTGFQVSTYAEYICLTEDRVVAKKPINMTFKEATAVPFGGLTALKFLKVGKIQPGQNVLINGASGAVGTYAVQLAKHFGADVTGVCSTANLDLVMSLGADQVIDYTKEEVARDSETYDLIVDTIGNISVARWNRLLKPAGTLLLVVAGLPQMMQGAWVSLTSSKRVISEPAGATSEDLVFLRELIEQETIQAVIDRCYPFEEIVEAHRYVDQGHKKGNVVIAIDNLSCSPSCGRRLY